jgi:hypothetical protein
LGSVHS